MGSGLRLDRTFHLAGSTGTFMIYGTRDVSRTAKHYQDCDKD